jgi:transcriptional regulator with XRE-family HTH domain
MPQGGPRLRAKDGKLNRVGGRVRQRRKELKMQQKSLLGRLADVTDGGWNPTPQEVLRIENGTRIVTDTEVVALAQALECDPCRLLID